MKTLFEAAPALLLEYRKRLTAAYAQGKLRKADLDEGIQHLNALFALAKKSEGKQGAQKATQEGEATANEDEMK